MVTTPRDWQIDVVGEPQQSDLEQLRRGLRQYNDEQAGSWPRQELACFVRAEDGRVLGGVYGRITFAWLHVEWLWVGAELRGQGIASDLLKRLEQHAKEHLQASNGYLETASFQALGFYKKQGYQVFGQLDDMPPGHSCYFLKKAL
ncbi:acetyltransferase [Idiomarina xiamenensis 10-D-4]|uniref:Acetyltransferase n=2 Tax=Idiomarina xiamenensis TaxID=1207041 RepID=K2KPH4_9GAMM|nr:acetyltransferase [Idiomarina xiamenensis 10-D-4]